MDPYVYLAVPPVGSVGRAVPLYEGAAASIEDSPDPGTRRLVERFPARVVGTVRIDVRPDAPQR